MIPLGTPKVSYPGLTEHLIKLHTISGVHRWCNPNMEKSESLGPNPTTCKCSSEGPSRVIQSQALLLPLVLSRAKWMIPWGKRGESMAGDGIGSNSKVKVLNTLFTNESLTLKLILKRTSWIIDPTNVNRDVIKSSSEICTLHFWHISPFQKENPNLGPRHQPC